MATFKVNVDFIFNTTMNIEAPDEAAAQEMVMNATPEQIAHLNGKNYASVGESARVIKSVEEVI